MIGLIIRLLARYNLSSTSFINIKLKILDGLGVKSLIT